MEKNEILLVKRHLATWNDRHEQSRISDLEKIYAPDLDIIDPHFVAHGHSELNGLIENLHKKFPIYKFTLRKPIEHHHNVARLYWQLGSKDKLDVETGMDIITLENRLIKT